MHNLGNWHKISFVYIKNKNWIFGLKSLCVSVRNLAILLHLMKTFFTRRIQQTSDMPVLCQSSLSSSLKFTEEDPAACLRLGATGSRIVFRPLLVPWGLSLGRRILGRQKNPPPPSLPELGESPPYLLHSGPSSSSTHWPAFTGGQAGHGAVSCIVSESTLSSWAISIVVNKWFLLLIRCTLWCCI